MTSLNLKKATPVIVVLWICLISTVVAQPQPKIQNLSVRAPLYIKIDGELTEWTEKNLSAYNDANRIYYVVSNDDDNLYLTVRASGLAAGSKVLKEGVKFTVSPSLEKSKKNTDSRNVSVTDPRTPDARIVSSMMLPYTAIAKLIKDPIKNKKGIDSLNNISNKLIGSFSKEIRVQGVTGVKDSVFSIYNSIGIKAAIHFSNGEPVIELALPLKALNLTPGTSTPFGYNIKLPAPAGNFNLNDIQKGGTPSSEIPIDDLYRATDTDLWGEYVLAKKIQ